MAARNAPSEKTISDKGRPTPEPTQAEYRQLEEEVVEEVNKQPRVRLRLYQVPKDSSDMPLPDVTVAINGYVWLIQRGVPVEVPEEVANILETAGHI